MAGGIPLAPSTPVQQSPLVSLSLPTNMVYGSNPAGPSPVLQTLQRNLLRQIGMDDTPVDPMTGATAAPLSPFLEMVQKYYPADRPMPAMPREFAGGMDPYPQAERAPTTVDWTSILLAARTGLEESPLGSLLRVDQMRKAMSMHRQPGYDFYNDRQIHDAGYGNQMHLFLGSMSHDMTGWMIQRLQEKARMGEYVEGMGPTGAIMKFAGGILGDPLTYLPATLGVKAGDLALRRTLGTISGAEMKLLSTQSVFWGSFADTLANVSLTAGVHIASQSAQKFVDPASQLDDVLDSLFLPVALAGVSQFVTSAFTRHAAHGLKDAVREPGFLRGHAPSGARYVPDDFVGPVIHPDDEAAAALVSRYDRANRRMERVDYGLGPELPGRSLAGDSDYVAGKFGKQPDIPYNGLPRNGAFTPGSLATNYGPMRTEEALRDAATEAILRTAGTHPGVFSNTPRTLKEMVSDAVKDALLREQEAARARKLGEGGTIAGQMNEKALPTSIRGADGVTYHAADQRLDANISGEDGRQWKIVGSKGKPIGWVPAPEFATEASAATGGRGFIKNAAGAAPKTKRLVDMEFQPGELERAGAPETTSAHVAALPGTTRTMPGRLFESVKHGTQQGYVVMPDGKIFELGEGFMGPNGMSPVKNGARGLHAAFFAHFPDMSEHAMRLVRFGDELAADVPAAGRTEQQTAALRSLKAQWDRQGLGDRIRFDTAGPDDGLPGSVGAAINPQSQAYQREVQIAQNRMAPTGIGMENLPLDPVSRTFQGLSLFAMQLVSDLVATGGRLTVGNLLGRTVGTRAPVEQLIEANWGKQVVDLTRRQHDAWHEYKQALAKAGGQTGIQPVDYAGRTDMHRLAYEVGDSLRSMINRGDPGINFETFRNRVAKALNNGDADELTDAATAYVNREAAAQRAFYNRTRDLALEHKVFDEAYEKGRDLALSEVRALKKEADDVARRSRLEKWDPARTRAAEEALIARTEDAQFRLRQNEEELKKLRDGGPSMNGTAPSYRPRLWDVGELTRLENEFVSEISDWLQMRSKGTLDQAEAVRISKEIHGLVSRQNPVYDRGDMEALFKSVASPSSAMARSLTIPDKMIEKYLINDSEVLLRYHARQMGTAIEMKQRFGSLDLKEQIAEIQQEYRALIQRAKAGEVGLPPVADIEKMMNGAIADMQVLRDRLYGTHGASADPHNWSSRTIRMAKQFANITLLGMSGISSLGDFVRPLMTEGLDAMYGYGLRSLMSDSRGAIMALSRKDMELAGTGMDLMNNVRALQAADIGDVFGSRGRLEHYMGQANQWMFVANGLNQLTEWSKRWSSIMIQGRMNETLLSMAHGAAGGSAKLNPRLAKFADDQLQDLITQSEQQIKRMEVGAADTRHAMTKRDFYRDQAQQLRGAVVEYQLDLQVRQGAAPGKLSDPTDIARLASFNIDDAMAKRIGLQLKIYGQKFDDLTLANVGEWKDELAAELYKSMLFQSINRTVVTPGVGDRSTWMSTELGGLVSQYKAWGVANLIRSMQSGLQEGGNQFWYGAAAAVGFAIILNEVRSRLFYDHSTFDRPATAVIADGVDRSSILGWFSDANRAIETLTGNRLGFRPLMGAVNSKPVDPMQAVGTIAGPAAGQGARAVSVLNDFIRDHPTAKTYNNWRTLIPGNTLPYLDPVFDRAISDGNFRKSMDRSNERKRRLLQE